MSQTLSPLAQRLADFWKFHGFKSRSAFAAAIPISRQLIDRIYNKDKRNGKYPEASLTVIKAIAEIYPDINLNWLILGEGPMLRAHSPKESPMTNGHYIEPVTKATFLAETIETAAKNLRSEIAKMKQLATNQE